MPKKTSNNAAKNSPGRGRGCGRKEDPSSPTPSPSRSPSDGEDAGSNASRASSVASIAASVASTSSQPTLAKKKAKKTQFCLDVQEKQLMCEQWVKVNFGFLKTVVRHRAEPVNSVKETIAAHSGDLEAAEGACAEIVVDDDSTPSPVPSSSSQGNGKRGQDDDQLLQSLQKRVHESGELLKRLAQPQPITITAAFANCMRDSLLSMSKFKFRKAWSHFTSILSELLDEESDEEEPPIVPTFPAPASMQPSSAPATYTPTASEMYQPPPHMWRHKALAASVWGSQTTDYVDPHMQQPLQPQYQQQQPQYQRMKPPPPHYGFQPPPQITQQPSSASASAAIGSADQALNQSPSAFDTSGQSL